MRSETRYFAKFLAIILLLAAKEVEKRFEETVYKSKKKTKKEAGMKSSIWDLKI